MSLPLKDLFWRTVRRCVAELSPGVVHLLKISGFPSVNQCLVPGQCPVFGLILETRKGVGVFSIQLQVWH